jgi:hypothetical protein
MNPSRRLEPLGGARVLPRIALNVPQSPTNAPILEKIPDGLGHALRGDRAEFEKIVSEDAAFALIPDTIKLESPAFDDVGSIPACYTDDGTGISPPLTISGLAPGSEALTLIVEDPDAPASEPIVHLLVWDLAPANAAFQEGMFKRPNHPGPGGNRGS